MRSRRSSPPRSAALVNFLRQESRSAFGDCAIGVTEAATVDDDTGVVELVETFDEAAEVVGAEIVMDDCEALDDVLELLEAREEEMELELSFDVSHELRLLHLWVAYLSTPSTIASSFLPSL